jgi:exopolyphosphatase/pppGpp-phosphohydrolase
MKLGPSGSFRVIDREKEMVHLGSEPLASGRSSATAMRRGLEVLRKYDYLVKNGGASRPWRSR